LEGARVVVAGPVAAERGHGTAGPAAPGLAPAVLEAVLERITYANANEETGYTVARVATPVTRPGPAPGALVARADVEPPARRNPERAAVNSCG
jgi:hypothetical protein